MLQQRSLVIHNGCQHQDVPVDFAPGMVALTGPNACGKTNVIQLNVYGLTGIVDKSWGSQKDFNRTGTTDGYVMVTLFDTIKGNLVIVRRNFTTGVKYPDKLWINDDKHDPDIVGREKVNLYLSSVLFGSSCTVLSDLLWLKQGQISWLLTANATSVYNFFNSIFDTSKIRQIRDILMDIIGRISFYKIDQSDIDRCVAEIEHNKELLKTLSSEELSLKLAALQETQKKLYGMSSGTISASEKSARIETINRKIIETKAFIDFLNKDIGSFNTPPCTWVTDAHKEFVKTYAQTVDSLAEYDTNILKLSSDISRYDISIASDTRELNGLLGQKTVLINTVSVVTSAESCPLCSSDIKDHDHYVKNAYRLYDLENSLAQFDTRIKQLSAKIECDKETRQTSNVSLDGLKRDAAVMRDYIKRGTDVYTKLVDAINRNNLWESTPRDINVIKQRLNASTGNLKDYENQLAETNLIPICSSDLQSDIATVDGQITGVQQEIAKIEGDIRSAEVCLRKAEESLEKLEQVKAENSNAQMWYDTLTAVRESTHNTRIPSRYLFDKVNILNKEMAVYCSMSGLSYTVFLDHEDFTFKFSLNGTVRNAGQLSGAQKTLCAIILQLALIRVVHPMLSVIMADEPTVFLDDENRGKLILLFHNMRSILSSSGTVFIIPTHDKEIISTCDRVIDFTRKG